MIFFMVCPPVPFAGYLRPPPPRPPPPPEGRDPPPDGRDPLELGLEPLYEEVPRLDAPRLLAAAVEELGLREPL
jgi:hypothetical protein